MGEVRLTWVSDTILLQKFIGHRGGAYGIIDIASKKIIKTSGFKSDGANIWIINGKVVFRKFQEDKSGKIQMLSEQLFPQK